MDYGFKKKLNLKKLELSWKEDSSVPIGWSLRFLRELRSLRCVRCVGWKPRLEHDQLSDRPDKQHDDDDLSERLSEDNDEQDEPIDAVDRTVADAVQRLVVRRRRTDGARTPGELLHSTSTAVTSGVYPTTP